MLVSERVTWVPKRWQQWWLVETGQKNGSVVTCQSMTRWWFKIFFIFTPIWGRFPFWLIFFEGVETTNQMIVTDQSKKQTLYPKGFPYNPWDWYIYLDEWLICMVNLVGKLVPFVPGMLWVWYLYPSIPCNVCEDSLDGQRFNKCQTTAAGTDDTIP